MAKISTSTIGFPRIGPNREVKFALESYWSKKISEEELLQTAAQIQADAWRQQKSAGVELVGADGTLYDHLLDAAFLLGIIPQRFQGLPAGSYAQYFAMARGAGGGVQALDMSKFFDTNYHVMIPELEPGWAPCPNFSHFLDKVQRCQAAVGVGAAVPIVIGPLTFASLARQTGGGPRLPVAEVVQRLLPAYEALLGELARLQVPEVQLHEPILVTTAGAQLKPAGEAAYARLAAAAAAAASPASPLGLQLVTYFDDLGEAYEWVVGLPVAGVAMDFVGVAGAAQRNRSLELVRKHGFPAGKRLGAGVVDGRSVWASPDTARALVGELLALGVGELSVQPSVPLYLLPVDVQREAKLDASVRSRLAFAVQKLDEVVAAARGAAPCVAGSALKVAADVAGDVPPAMFDRPLPYPQRREQQPTFHAFPTTTIGSFPQTPEVRRLRLHFKQGRITPEQYHEGIAAHVGHDIGVQEALGLDVLVHGESERTDMVEYFGQQLEGMAFTEHGWVQSYGSRCVRPPLVVGDVRFVGAMTVHEFKVAQALTKRPVKGMLTGPVTILNWSFPRVDITRRAQAFQLALALREEVRLLEEAGCAIIQVDEPALREGLPLKAERWAPYLDWAVRAFRLTCAVAAPATQIVTHLCYSNFEDIMGAIDAMDADVLTIENSRSGDEMLRALAGAQYGRDVGPGVYDVHSPEVPSVEFVKGKIRSFLSSGVLGGRADRLWVNPDCGLKTRAWPETIAALRNMVQAAAEMRAELAAAGGSACNAAAGAVAGVGGAGAALGGSSAAPRVACCCCHGCE